MGSASCHRRASSPGSPPARALWYPDTPRKWPRGLGLYARHPLGVPAMYSRGQHCPLTMSEISGSSVLTRRGTVRPLLRVLHLRLRLLAKFSQTPPNQYSWCFCDRCVFHTGVESWSCPRTHGAGVPRRSALPPRLGSTVNRCPFRRLLSATCFTVLRLAG